MSPRTRLIVFGSRNLEIFWQGTCKSKFLTKIFWILAIANFDGQSDVWRFVGGNRRKNGNWELVGLYVALCGDLVEGKSQLGVSCLMSSSPMGVLANLWGSAGIVHHRHHLYAKTRNVVLFLDIEYKVTAAVKQPWVNHAFLGNSAKSEWGADQRSL